MTNLLQKHLNPSMDLRTTTSSHMLEFYLLVRFVMLMNILVDFSENKAQDRTIEKLKDKCKALSKTVKKQAKTSAK